MARNGCGSSVFAWATLAGAAAFTAWVMWSLPAIGAVPDGLQLEGRTGAATARAGHGSATGPVRSAIAGCQFDPLLPARTRADGLFAARDTVAGGNVPRIDAFIAAARQEIRRGRARNAETALISACRIAARRWPGQSMPLADAQRALASLYLTAAGPTGLRDPETIARAQALLAESLAGYQAVLGDGASKTRTTARQLAASFSPDSAVAVGAIPEEPTSADSAASSAALTGTGCVRSGDSIACTDPELAQLASDLDRLRAQVASVTSDPDGFRHRTERSAAARDGACHDKACLVRWFAQRRSELIAEFGRGPAQAGHSVTARR